MRQAFKEIRLLRDDDGTNDEEGTGRILGVSLGFDFCAEHEWGIEGILDTLGVRTRGDIGIEKRLVSIAEGDLDKILGFFDWPNETKTLPAETRIVGGYEFRFERDSFAKRMSSTYGLPVRRGGPLEASWDSRSFCIRAFGCAEREFLRDLHQAFSRNDVAIGTGGGMSPFGGASLKLLIASRLPSAVVDKIREDDLDAIRLEKASRATGIHDTLEVAGLRYYALQPKWITSFGSLAGRRGETSPKERSSHDVIFWLNPHDQSRYDCGWFTVEELEAWCEGRGPVVKARRAAISAIDR